MRWFSLNRVLFLLLISCLSQSNASAIPIQWTLSGGLFDDGGTVFGSFLFDADTASFEAVAIQTTAGASLAGVAYPDFAEGDASILFLYSDPSIFGGSDPDFTGITIFALGLTGPMTNAGGLIALGTDGQGSEIACADSFCSDGAFRFITAGEIAGAPLAQVPEPSSVALLAIGLAALCGGVTARKRLHGARADHRRGEQGSIAPSQ